MGRTTSRRQAERDRQIAELKRLLSKHAVDFDNIHRCVDKAKQLADEKWLRAARPLTDSEPIDRGIAPPLPPAQATIIATDGSQIMPDRHAPFLYYLINVGGIVYHHGDGRPPETFTQPQITYPSDDLDESIAQFNTATVSIRRDLAEISTLARTVWEHRYETAPLVAIVDQRLLYWPMGSTDPSESQGAIDGWLKAIEDMRACNAIVAGYIDRPGKLSVLNMLQAMSIDEPDFDVATLTQSSRSLDDSDLFSQILEPGERSPVFLEVSSLNDRFAEKNQEICFFYLNPGRTGQKLARVDLPLWAAQQPEVVEQLHGLLYHQCQILLGGYPYVLTRADEEAVVGGQDRAYLDSWIELTMQNHGVQAAQTDKQSGKDIARAAKMRHEM